MQAKWKLCVLSILVLFSACSNNEKFTLLNENKKLYKAVDKLLDNNKYTLEDPFTMVNPYGISPLTAYIVFNTNTETKVTVQVEAKSKSTTFPHTIDEFTTHHVIPVLGLYPDTENKVIIVLKDKDNKAFRKDVILKTGKLPKNFQKVSLERKISHKISSDPIFISPALNDPIAIYLSAYDNNGDVRWYFNRNDLGNTMHPKKLANGHLLVPAEKGEEIYYRFVAYEMDLLGKIYKAYEINKIHHDFAELPNGNLLVATAKEGRDSVEDYIVEINRKNGKVVKEWDLKKILDLTDYKADPAFEINLLEDSKLANPDFNKQEHLAFASKKARHDWFHMNSIQYIDKEKSFIISGRNQSMVAKIDYETGNLKWILTDPKSPFLTDKSRKYLLKPLDKNFQYNYGQHSARQESKNTLVLYDNGNNQSKLVADMVKAENNYSQMRIFTIDEDKLTISAKYTYGKQFKSARYTPFIGSVQKFRPHYYGILFGGIFQDTDGKASDSLIVAAYPEINREAYYTEIIDNENVFELHIDNTVYSARRQSLY